MKLVIFIVAFASYLMAGSGFVLVTPLSRSATSTRSFTTVTMSAARSDRREFLALAIAGGAGLAMSTVAESALAAADEASSGELGDLSAGADVVPLGAPKAGVDAGISASAEEDARVLRKLAAQAKAVGKSSPGRMTYAESRSSELEKQARIEEEKKDAKRRRAALCEQLGRGC